MDLEGNDAAIAVLRKEFLEDPTGQGYRAIYDKEDLSIEEFQILTAILHGVRDDAPVVDIDEPLALAKFLDPTEFRKLDQAGRSLLLGMVTNGVMDVNKASRATLADLFDPLGKTIAKFNALTRRRLRREEELFDVRVGLPTGQTGAGFTEYWHVGRAFPRHAEHWDAKRQVPEAARKIAEAEQRMLDLMPEAAKIPNGTKERDAADQEIALAMGGALDAHEAKILADAALEEAKAAVDALTAEGAKAGG